MTADPQTLRRYLLGELSEADERAIDEQMAVDDHVHEQLCAVEDELLVDYGAKKLSNQQRAAVKLRLLSRPDAAERVRFGASLSALADAAPVAAVESGWSRLWQWLRGPRLAVAGAVACAAAIALFYVARPAPETKVAVVEVTLEPTSVRAEEPVPELPPRSRVRLVLELEPGAADGAGELVAVVAGREIRAARREGAVEIVMDRSALDPGLLEIELVGVKDGVRETISYYEVRVSGSP